MSKLYNQSSVWWVSLISVVDLVNSVHTYRKSDTKDALHLSILALVIVMIWFFYLLFQLTLLRVATKLDSQNSESMPMQVWKIELERLNKNASRLCLCGLLLSYYVSRY